MRNDLAGFLDNHPIIDPNILALDLIEVMERCSRDCGSCQLHRLELSHGCDRASLSYLGLDRQEFRDSLVFFDLVGDDPAWGFAGRAERFALLERVAGTGGSASWEAQYNFVNEYNVSSSISLTQGIGFYNTIGVLTQVKQGTGYWTTISGTPLTLQSAIVPSFNNISWLVPTNTTGVTANLANNTLVTYPSPLPSGFNNIYGILITGNTAGDGIQYLP